jgi:hypothetical protein
MKSHHCPICLRNCNVGRPRTTTVALIEILREESGVDRILTKAYLAERLFLEPESVGPTLSRARKISGLDIRNVHGRGYYLYEEPVKQDQKSLEV